MAFSATNAATEGFRIVRREPWTIVAWAIMSLTITLVLLALLGPGLVALQAGRASVPGASVADRMASVVNRLVVDAVVLGLSVLVAAVVGSAAYRAVLRPSDSGFARLRLGADELRTALMLSVFAVSCLVCATAAAAVVYVSQIATPAGSNRGAVLVAAVMVCLAFAWVMIWLNVRLSLAAPMSFSQGRLRVFAAWKLTRGRFWPLLGCYLLAIIYMLFLVMVSAIAYGLIGVADGASISQMVEAAMRPRYASLLALNPAIVIYLMVRASVAAVIYAVIFAPAAAAYKAIAELSPDNQAAAFD